MKIWTARILIGIVLFFNLQCAFEFLFFPQYFVSGFNLEGIPGIMLVRAMGLLFLMWNVPYMFAVYNPAMNYISLYEATLMQFIGVAGETILFIQLPKEYVALHDTVFRFILFDFCGLILLIVSVFIIKNSIRHWIWGGSKS